MANKGLTFGALGLLLVILDHAPNWDISTGRLLEQVRVGGGDERTQLHALRLIVDELYDHGYLARVKRKFVDGKFREVIEAFADPTEAPVQTEIIHPDQVVYVIGQPGGSIVKIGTTSNLRARLRVIQTGCPVRLQVLWSCPGGRRLESCLHGIYAHLRLEGEWFRFHHSDPISSVKETVDEARIRGVR